MVIYVNMMIVHSTQLLTNYFVAIYSKIDNFMYKKKKEKNFYQSPLKIKLLLL